MGGAARRPAGRVTMIGALPPPVWGMTLVTAAVTESLRARFAVEVWDISPGTPRRSLVYHARKLTRVARAAARLTLGALRGGGRRVLYLPSDGRKGIVYTIGLLALARAAGYRTFLHHHNYSYVARDSRLMRMACRAAGPRATHVLLCPRMSTEFRQRYRGVQDTFVLSNARFVAPEGARRPSRSGPLILGHLGNLDVDKGLDLVLAVFGRFARERDARLLLGGAPGSREAERRLREAADAHGAAVELRGPLGGQEKAGFLRELDVFLFPSRLPEAEPLVVLEALAHGVPVIARGSGCIPGLLRDGCGVSVEPGADFVEAALERLRSWERDRAALEGVARLAAVRFRELRTDSEARWESLMAAIGAAAE